MSPFRIFISSVQFEFAEERKRLVEYIRQDALFSRYFETFLFEEQPAQNASAQRAYLDAAAKADVYLLLLGEWYGNEDAEGISPTEREYDAATANGVYRLAFIKTAIHREKKEAAFKHKIDQNITRNPLPFGSFDELRNHVYAALVHYLIVKGLLASGSFDAAVHPLASIDDLDNDKIRWFVGVAREKRNFPLLYSDENVHTILSSLHLIDDSDGVTNAALLLFAQDVQKWFPAATVKCAQFYGNRVEKPILSQQIYEGNVFDVVDKAVGFVLSRIDAHVGERTQSAQVDVSYELPVQAVTEAVVNAVVHRDYASTGSVQVMLFKNRLEVWNPGRLPQGITIVNLGKDHQSIPVNPILVRPVYLAGYIEQLGTGTTDLIKRCLDLGLRCPEFRQDENFVSVLWRREVDDATCQVTGQETGHVAEQEQVTNAAAGQVAGQVTVHVTGQETGHVAEQVKRVICAIAGHTLTRKEIMGKLSLKGRNSFCALYLEPSISDGYVAQLYPNSAKRRDQAYYLTEKGLKLFVLLKNDG